MDSCCIVITNPDSKKIHFISWIQLHRFANSDLRVQSLKIWFMDSICRLIFKRFNLFSWILTNPDKSLVHRRTFNKPKSIQILGFGFANLYCFQKICFVDLFHPTVFKRFVSWIPFVDLFSKDSFCENKNPKLLDSFCFRRICIRFPHP